MIIAHLPSGYVAARMTGYPSGPVFWAILAGSVFPDLDLIWFYLIDDRAFHHHKYWVHAPGFWLLVAAVALPVIATLARHWLLPAVAFLAIIFLHLILDSLVGSIMWTWPFSDQLYQLFTVATTKHHWIISFMLHPSFLAEIAITIWALVLFLRRPAR